MSLETRLSSLVNTIAYWVKETAFEATLPLFPSFVPPSSGHCMAPPGMVGTTSTAWTASTTNRQYFTPFLITKNWNCNAAIINIVTAVAGGTSPLVRVGLYAADPVTGYPDTSNLLRSGSFIPSATGNRTVTWDEGSIALGRGIYFVSSIFTNAAAPTTYPSATCYNNVAWNFPVTGGPASGAVRGLYLTGQSTLKTTATSNSSFPTTAGSDCVAIWLKAA